MLCNTWVRAKVVVSRLPFQFLLVDVRLKPSLHANALHLKLPMLLRLGAHYVKASIVNVGTCIGITMELKGVQIFWIQNHKEWLKKHLNFWYIGIVKPFINHQYTSNPKCKKYQIMNFFNTPK